MIGLTFILISTTVITICQADVSIFRYINCNYVYTIRSVWGINPVKKRILKEVDRYFVITLILNVR